MNELIECGKCGRIFSEKESAQIQYKNEVFDVCPYCLKELINIQYSEPEGISREWAQKAHA